MSWVLSAMLPVFERLAIKLLEAKFPWLVPILTELTGVLDGEVPSAHLQTVANQFNALVAAAPEIKKS